MKAFSDLYVAIDSTTSTNEKVAALAAYFRAASPIDACWAVFFLTGNRLRQAIPSKKLHAYAAEAAGVPLWLFEESYDAVGDLAETIALILPPLAASSFSLPLHIWVTERLAALRIESKPGGKANGKVGETIKIPFSSMPK